MPFCLILNLSLFGYGWLEMGAETFLMNVEMDKTQDSAVGIIVYWWAMLSEKTL